MPVRRSRKPLIVSLIAFAAGLGLLAWCVSIAFGPENREEIAKLKSASIAQIAGLLGLSLASLFINGVIFQATLRPVRTLGIGDVASTNAIAAFLGYLPAKIGLVIRIGIHSRRDRVPLLMIGAWFAAVAVVMLLTIACLVAASLIARRIDAVWWSVLAGCSILGGGVLVGGSRFFAGERGLERIRTLIGFGPLRKILASRAFANVHAATAMLADAKVVALTMGLRIVDIALQAARVPLAAAILGHTLPYAQAFMIASTSFIIGIISPGGPVGAREAGVTKLCELLDIPNAKAFALVALLVSATEAVAYLIGALAGAAWLGPRSLLRSGKRDGSS